MLQKAVDTCNADSGTVEDCKVLELNKDADMDNCIIPPSIDEETEGWLDALPGCNPIQPGPGMAVIPEDCVDNSVIGPRKKFHSDMSELGWDYVGCAT